MHASVHSCSDKCKYYKRIYTYMRKYVYSSCEISVHNEGMLLALYQYSW